MIFFFRNKVCGGFQISLSESFQNGLENFCAFLWIVENRVEICFAKPRKGGVWVSEGPLGESEGDVVVYNPGGDEMIKELVTIVLEMECKGVGDAGKKSFFGRLKSVGFSDFFS